MRKKKHPEHENHERWLVSYADFITLLFAFFVVMFATSQVDSAKVGRFVESANVAFNYKGVFPQSSPHPIQASDAGMSPSGRPQIVPSRSPITPTSGLSKKGKEVRKAVEKMVERTALGGRVRIREDRRGVTVSLAEAGFFAPGSAAVKPDSLETLRQIGEMLKDAGTPVVVEGHTDNTPIHTAVFPSNWQLSTARATSIVSYLVEALGYDPGRLAAAGYGEYHPVADNTTPDGRAQNRRVDIVVLTEGSEGPLPK